MRITQEEVPKKNRPPLGERGGRYREERYCSAGALGREAGSFSGTILHQRRAKLWAQTRHLAKGLGQVTLDLFGTIAKIL